MKILILLVAVVGLTIVIVSWWFVQSNKEAKQEQEEVLIEQIENQVIPEALEAVAEEEYAIEFEADNSAVDINLQFCDFVKEQCEEQGIDDCEDYKMCIEGIEGSKQ